MSKVISRDGTAIAFDRAGEGPRLILVGGALSVRTHPRVKQMVTLLAPHYTVFSYDRRGRGDSGDTPPYAVEREVEDIEALIDEAGGSALVYGASSGAALALETANRVPTKIKKLALFEPPFIVDDSRPPVPEEYVEQIDEAIEAGRRGEAVEIFMKKAVLVPDELLAQMKEDPSWQGMEAVAHTLAYDGAVMGDRMSGKPLAPGQWASATMPILVIDGGASPAWVHNTVRALADELPNGRRLTLEGQMHNVDPEALVPVLVEFFE